MDLATIKEFLESERSNTSVRIFVLKKSRNSTYEICDATAKCKLKIENATADFQVGEYKRILRPKKDANNSGIIINAKSRIVPTKQFSLGKFSPQKTDDSEGNDNSKRSTVSKPMMTVLNDESCTPKANKVVNNYF